MTTPAVTPQTPNPLAEFGGVSVDAQSTPAQPATPSSPSTTNPLAEFGGITIPEENTPPSVSPEEKASQTRQMLVSGLTGMPTPNMTAEDKANFEKGKAAGAISVPLVAGTTALIGATAPEIAAGTKAVQAMAEAHPAAAKFIKKVLTGAIAGHSMGHTATGAALGLLWDLLP